VTLTLTLAKVSYLQHAYHNMRLW